MAHLTSDSVVETGIAGLDSLLMGGVPMTNVILVEGSTGTGKTLFGVEFIYRGITQFNEPGIIVVFEISPDKLIRDAAKMGWDLADLRAQKKLDIIFSSPHVLDQELRAPNSLLLETAAEMGAKRIFIDGLGVLFPPSAGASLNTTGPGSFREGMQQLVEALNREHLTALLSHEIASDSDSQVTLHAAGALVDTVIRLRRTLMKRRVFRSLEIVKSRGQDFDPGEHTLHIQDGKGLEIFRRVQAPLRTVDVQPTSNVRHSVMGEPALDCLLGGGVFEGSTTMVVGLSGVGKTVLGTQILIEGATHQDTRGLLVSLDEHPAQISRNSATIGIDIQAQIDAGAIHVLFESPQELNIDAHFAKITQIIEKYDIRRMVIDGMTSYSTALVDQSIYRDFFHALVAYSKRRLMTTFFNYENPEFLGLSTFMPDFPVSSIVDNIVLLSLVEIKSTLRRCLTVVKARGSPHEFDSREYVIGQGGITLLPFDESVAQIMPLASYSGILSRAPSRMPAARGGAG